MKQRIKLADRQLPNYSKGEEIFNMVSHIVGAALGIAALVLCIIDFGQASQWNRRCFQLHLWGNFNCFIYNVQCLSWFKTGNG